MADPFGAALASAQLLYATISKAKEMWDTSTWNRQVAKELILFIQDLECNNEDLQRITKERRTRAFHRMATLGQELKDATVKAEKLLGVTNRPWTSRIWGSDTQAKLADLRRDVMFSFLKNVVLANLHIAHLNGEQSREFYEEARQHMYERFERAYARGRNEGLNAGNLAALQKALRDEVRSTFRSYTMRRQVTETPQQRVEDIFDSVEALTLIAEEDDDGLIADIVAGTDESKVGNSEAVDLYVASQRSESRAHVIAHLLSNSSGELSL